MPPSMLSITDFVLREQKVAYLHINADLKIIEYRGDSTLLLQVVQLDGTLHCMVTELIPELYGCEDLLLAMLQGDEPKFCLENLNRVNEATQEVTYLNLTIFPYDVQTLVITLLDITAWSQVQQTLTQQRNELHLLKQSLDDTNNRLQYILKRYVPAEVGKALMEKRIMPELGGTVRCISVLFADLRNYTTISERLTPTETIEILSICLDMVTQAIMSMGGVVVNYMGDGVMAIFNAPDEQPDHAQRVVKAGVMIQKMAKEMRAKLPPDTPLLTFGVGINTGDALVGNIGAQWHHQYSAVGDTINVASRICSYARPNEVLIACYTHDFVSKNIIANALPPLKFKGKSQEMVVYQVEEWIGELQTTVTE
ncbi:family 3 adenylate cyclase [Beggiatoa alba B18LD]|uniref:Family 3 adenylate cyclase n=1 Tax=Beggiatoa alba B18LD TaxID=395493 RepID=I3CBY0_9GAMM|nr:adenylate/guanylate cyclase domain-containing protein [Beggiatoa alba]EIJ41123.1 family 3 adenylate cyclase [Beggiatoa alba B18LD]